jgi:hypothetical protein
MNGKEIMRELSNRWSKLDDKHKHVRVALCL